MDKKELDFSVSAYLLPRVNREGLKFGFIALAIAIANALLAYALAPCWEIPARLCAFIALPLFLLAYGVFMFFRDPDRFPPADAKAVLSPADGKVSLIKKQAWPAELRPESVPEAEWTAKTYHRVTVFMSVLNVHVNRMPTAGKILRKVHTPGKFLNAALDKASEENERCAYLIETPAGVRYAVVQIAGLVAKRIVPFVDEGAELASAERFGLIRFGSRLDVYLPEGVEPEVREGQIMIAGETVLGRIA